MNEENTDGAVAPCVTILIPARNAIATIKRAIDSAANQTYPNIYINVLDDGSTDGTGQFVIEMQNTNYAGKIKHIILRNHIMRGAARNQLVTSCNTELACWLDADDMMEPTKIEKQVKYMLDHPECNYVATNMFQVGNDNAVDLDTAMKVDNLTYMKLIDENPIPGCTVMFKTDVAKTFQYNETKDADGIEDHGMWKQIVYAGHKMHFIDEPLYHYTVRKHETIDPREKKIFRFDDICTNTDMENCNALANCIRERFPYAEIQYAMSPLVFNLENENKSERQRTFPSIFNAQSDVRNFFAVEKMGMVSDELVPNFVVRANHGLFHVDHRFLSRREQEMSIIAGASLTRSKIFVPPFNKFDGNTMSICREFGFTIHRFTEDGWTNMEHEPWNHERMLWYLHPRLWTVDKLNEYFL